MWGSRGHITEEGGSEKRDGDKVERRTGEHRLNGRTAKLESRQGGEIKTGCGEITFKGGDVWQRGRAGS